MSSLRLCAVLFALLPCLCGRAQSPRQLRLSAGAGVCWPVSKGNAGSYMAVVLPQAALQLFLPLGERVGLLTGLAYQQKGYDSRSELRGAPPNNTDADVYLGYTRYHFATIPLEVAVRLRQHGRWALWLDGGMAYGFLMRAQTEVVWNTYRNDRLINSNTYLSRPEIGLLPRATRLAAGTPGYYPSLYRLNAAVAAALTLVLRKRYLLRAFYEYNLDDVASVQTISGGTLHLQAAGLSLGVGF